MVNVGGSTTPGVVTIRQNASSRTVDTVAGGNISQGWIYAPTLTPPGVLYLSATTPIPGGACGRVVFSDLHVSAGGGDGGHGLAGHAVSKRLRDHGPVTAREGPGVHAVRHRVLRASASAENPLGELTGTPGCR